ncbi:MAG TPA: SDR family NAD(P)-dependent oxidoreductase, partial [Edaphobacter sp.]
AAKLIEKYPALNVLINNAGIMKPDGIDGVVDDSIVASTVTTNILGPVRMTSALIEHLKKQPAAYIINTTSGLAFTPFAVAAVYSASKAALHSLTLSQRYLLRDTTVKVLELAPPYVQTELMGSQQAADPRAMPLKDFIAETIDVLGTDTNDVYTQRVLPLRNGAGPNDYEATVKLNQLLGSHE